MWAEEGTARVAVREVVVEPIGGVPTRVPAGPMCVGPMREDPIAEAAVAAAVVVAVVAVVGIDSPLLAAFAKLGRPLPLALLPDLLLPGLLA